MVGEDTPITDFGTYLRVGRVPSEFIENWELAKGKLGGKSEVRML